MKTTQKWLVLAAAVYALSAAALPADGAFIAGGFSGGAVVGQRSVPFTRLRLAGGWAFDSGFEIGAETGITADANVVIAPLALYAARRFPLGGAASIAAAVAAGGAVVGRGRGVVLGFDGTLGPRLELALNNESLPNMGIYFIAGADVFFEDQRTVFLPAAGIGIKYRL